MSQKYICGIIPASEEIYFGTMGPGNAAEVHTVRYDGVACVTSDYSGSSLSSMTREELARHLVAHQALCERVMERFNILPMRLGTLLGSKEEVLAMLQQGYTRFSDALARIEGKVEFEVAATWDLSRVLQEISRERDIVKLKESLETRPPEEAPEDRVLLGKMVKDSLDRRREDYRQRMVDFLRDVPLDIQENALLSDELVMNVAFLIDHAGEGELERRVRGLNDLFQDEINFRIIGPLPPYSFSTVEVVRPDVARIEEARGLLGLETEVCEVDVRQAYRRLVAMSHPDVNPDDPLADDKVNRLHGARTLLTEYCRGESNGGQGAETVPVSLSPEMVGRTFLISIKRAAPQSG